MADEMSTAACDKGSEKMWKSSDKIQRTVSSMIKQMELTEEEVKYRMENFENADIGKQYLKYLKYLKCTKCNLNFQNIIKKGKPVGMHPLLGVLLCDSCCDYYGDGNFSLDSEGEDKYCRWCGQGGTIFACSKCICGFCEECIRKHFGKHNLEEVKNDDDWVCYFCNPRPLWYLRSICSLAKEAAKNKRDRLELSKEGRSSRMSRGDDEDTSSNSNSSDSSWSASSIKQKKVKLKPKRFSKTREKIKREEEMKVMEIMKRMEWLKNPKGEKKESQTTESDERNQKVSDSSTSSDEYKPATVSKTKRKEKKKSLGRRATDESSGSDARTPKKKARMTDDRSCDCDLETIKIPLLEKLKSLWKLTQSTTEEGLRRCRERLLTLSKPENFNSVESLKKELDELKSCTKELMCPLSVVSSSIDSIGEDLMIYTAKDEREILQRPERELKRFEEESNMETSLNSDREAPSQADAAEEKRKEKEGVKEKKKAKEKSDEGSEGEGRDENGSVSRSQDEGGKDDSPKESTAAKPLLKVKSFAKMLDENVYDRKGISVNGNVSEKSPVVIDLLDVDSDGSNCDSQKKTDTVDGEKRTSESSENGVRKSSRKNTSARKRNSSKKGSKTSDEESLKDNDNSDDSEQEEEEDKSDVEKKRKEKKKIKKKMTRKSEKELSESEASETVQKEAKKSDQETDEKKDATSEEETQKETPEKDKNRSSNDESEKNDSEDASEKEKTEKRSSSEKSPEKTAKTGSSSEDSSGGEEKNRRITRNKKKDEEKLKVSFAEFKQVRKKFIESGKKKLNALDSSDSETERKEKSGKQKKRVLASSDEEGGESTKGSEHSNQESSEKEEQKSELDVETPPSEETSSDEMNTRQVKRKRVRKKRSSDSSGEDTKSKKRNKKKNKSSSSESSEDDSKEKKKGRKNIKKILKKDSLKLETKEALKNEEERKKRLKARQKLFEEAFPEQKDFAQLKHLVLDFDPVTNKPLVTVHKKLVRKLKPHQAKGVKFMWDSCFESVQRMEEDNGSGCILAHCMGLGKTLQVITLVHTVITHDLGLNTVLIVCPLSTVSNWMREFESWLADIHTDPIMLYDLVKYKRLEDRRFYLKDWQQSGGVLIMSYDLFRNLTKGLARKKKSQNQKVFESALLDPGPDLVICDEGHLLKNEDTALSKCMSKVRTSRRIVLTGTPLQNNLIEYHCMVQFVKPNVLGTKKEFCNRFVNPINNGQFEDSTELDVKIMKRRSHVLHSMLDGCIQRFDYSVLTPFLPEKHEYVLAIELTEKQAKAYRHFINNISARSAGSSRTASLFNDYHSLQRIWTHPRTMLMQSEKESMREEMDSEGSLKDFVVSTDEESSSSKSASSDSPVEVAPRKRITRSNANDPEVRKAIEEEDLAAKKNWWDEFYDESAYDDLRESNKLILLFDLLKHCAKVKDKLLVFSQSLYSLDLIEYFLGRISENRDKDSERLCGHRDTWVLGSDYFRLDGSTNSEKRANWCNYFNKESNTRGRLFLLSTKAGGLGINLYGANRVVIFDASWNPSHDLQSIFRVYRFGQKKTCYVYRFLSEATMEEKIYERQVTKLSLAHRVVDEHQIERHYTMGNLQALYTFDPTPKEARKVPILPKDSVLADLLAAHKELIVGYHEHDSLLENKQEEELSEEERKVAWKEYEEEKAQQTRVLDPIAQQQMLLLMQQARLAQGIQPGSTAQPVINPMYLQANPNIPLVVYQRGMKVGLTPGPNESLESYYMRIVNRENWLMSGGQ